MKFLSRRLLCISMFVFVSCNGDYMGQGQSMLVVEGWIENGGFPVVILTKTLPISEEEQSLYDMKDYLIRWATVTVSNGTDSVILTGKYDKGYMPPYIYTTGRLRGKAGETYTLTVDYREYHATATTTIPPSCAEVDFKVEKSAYSDTLYQIEASFTDNPYTKDYYQFFSRVGAKNKQYTASYLGCIDDVILNGEVKLPIYKEYSDVYFLADDTVSVKMAQLDAVSYVFWDDFLKSRALAGNIVFSTFTNVPSNISGGVGYWCGYNSVADYFIVGGDTCRTKTLSPDWTE